MNERKYFTISGRAPCLAVIRPKGDECDEWEIVCSECEASFIYRPLASMEEAAHAARRLTGSLCSRCGCEVIGV